MEGGSAGTSCLSIESPNVLIDESLHLNCQLEVINMTCVVNFVCLLACLLAVACNGVAPNSSFDKAPENSL